MVDELRDLREEIDSVKDNALFFQFSWLTEIDKNHFEVSCDTGLDLVYRHESTGDTFYICTISIELAKRLYKREVISFMDVSFDNPDLYFYDFDLEAFEKFCSVLE